MKRYNVIFITPRLDKPSLYHTDIIQTFEKLYNVFQYGPGFNYYSVKDNIQIVIKKSKMNPDIIVFGTAMSLYNLNIVGLNSISIPKIIFLNKEYQALSKKLNYIKRNSFNLVSTILNEKLYKPWEESIGIPFVQIPHGIFVDKFPVLDIEKKYDFGFLGALFTKYSVVHRERAKKFIFIDTDISKKYNILWGDDYNRKLFFGDEYIKMLNSCKMFLSTLSPNGIVGLRFYELSAVKTMMLCPRDYYDGIFKDGVNCVMYDDDPNSFKEKFEQYIKDDNGRNKIIERAYKDVLEKHSWEQRIQKLIRTLENIMEI